MKSRLVRASLSATLLPLLVGCVPNFETNPEAIPGPKAANGIVGGTKVETDRDPLAPSVVMLTIFTNRTDYSMCTGTLVGPQVVMTAGHCVKGLIGKKLRGLRSGLSTGRMSDAKDFPQMVVISPSGQKVAAVTVSAPPQMGLDATKKFLRDDIGLVALATPLIPRNANGTDAPRVSLDLKGRLRVGTRVLAMGYGLITKSLDPGAADGGERNDGLQKKYLSVIDPAAEGYDDADLGADTIWFEALVGDKVGVTCQGDSGGPMFVRASGKPMIAAVVSRGEKSCVQHTLATATAPHATWIRSTTTKWQKTLY